MLRLVAAVLLGLALTSHAATPVNVTVYGEALCPDTAAFVTEPVQDAVKMIGDIFTLKYVPWGNAKMISKNKFECQHGPMECTMNTVEACLIHYYPKRDDFLPFLDCVFHQYDRLTPAIGQKCAEENKLDWSKVDTCYRGDLGFALENMYAAETSALSPSHTYVPWVTINGKHNTMAEGNNLVWVVCQAYMGTKPAACNRNLNWKESSSNL